MSNKRKIQKWLIALGILVAIVIVIVIAFLGYEKDTKTKIGLIITGTTDDEGWNGAHYKGVFNACEKLDAQVIVKENVPEEKEKCKKAIQELVDEGVAMIILSSYAYPVLVEDVIEEYKDVAFYGISAELYADNITSYFGRMYQSRYLAGVLAGLKAENGSIGYVAAMPNSEVNRGINAFTLGVKSVNANATVNVIWTNSWDNKENEVIATQKLVNELKAEVITYHQNQSYVAGAADAQGIYSIGYNEKAEGLSDKYLTASVWDWEELYYQIIREVIQGRANSVRRHWFGIDTGVVKLSKYSSQVTETEIQRIETEKNEILSGNDVFSGVIYDNTGILRCNEGELISDEILLEKMDWYVDGVVIYGE